MGEKYTNSNGAGNQEEAVALFVDDLNNIYAAGMSTLDYAVVKYSQPTGIEEIPEPFSVTLFPNPSDGRFTVKTENTKVSLIEIYNLPGEKVYVSINLNLQTSTKIDLTSQPKGIYFIRTTGNTISETRKMILK